MEIVVLIEFTEFKFKIKNIKNLLQKRKIIEIQHKIKGITNIIN